MKFFMNMKVGNKVLVAFLAGSLLAILSVAIISYDVADAALEEESFNKLTAVREIKASQIEDYFDTIRKQALTFSESETVILAMKDFKKSFHSIGKELNVRNVNRYKEKVSSFLNNKFLPKYKDTTGKSSSSSEFMARSKEAIILQSLYIAENPNPMGSKHQLDRANDRSSYSKHHAEYHPILRDTSRSLVITISS